MKRDYNTLGASQLVKKVVLASFRTNYRNKLNWNIKTLKDSRESSEMRHRRGPMQTKNYNWLDLWETKGPKSKWKKMVSGWNSHIFVFFSFDYCFRLWASAKRFHAPISGCNSVSDYYIIINILPQNLVKLKEMMYNVAVFYFKNILHNNSKTCRKMTVNL